MAMLRKLRNFAGRLKRKPSSAEPYQTAGDSRNHVASGQQTVMQAAGGTSQSDPTAPGGSRIDGPAAIVTADIRYHTVPSAAEHLSESAQTSNGETPQSYPESSTLQLSCWAQAVESLKKNKPDVYEELEKIKSKHKDYRQNDPADLLKSVESRKRQDGHMPQVIERAIRSILIFKGVAATATSFDPHRIAPVVWQSFCVILEACLNDSTIQRNVPRDLNVITSNLAHWANVESLYLGSSKIDTLIKFDSLKSELVKLYTAILELEVELVNLASDGNIARVVKAQDRAVTWKNLIEEISSCHGTCKTAFEDCKMKIDQHDRIKMWISGYQPEATHGNILEMTGVDQTYRTCGQWLLDMPKFNDWSSTKSAEGHRIFWLRGTTGTGKTTLIGRIIQWHLDRASLYHDRRLAFFYCSRGTDLQHSYRAVLQALLRQAAYDSVNGEISENVLNAYKSAGGDSKDSQPFAFKKCDELLRGILKSGVKLRIIIDALDECDEPKKLLKALRDAFQDAPGRLELLVSSRYEVHVDEVFTNPVKVDINTSMPETDMITYITTEIKEREKDERILQGKRLDLEDQLIKILCGRAGGMFRWVELQLSFFLKSRPPFLRHETVEKHLKSLDTGTIASEEDLNAAYDDIFERNTADCQLEREHASRIYKMLLCCKESCSMAMITKAIAFDENDGSEDEEIDPAYIRQLTQDFIIETKQETLKFAHVSVRDYQHRSDYSDAKCHAQVVQTCLRYISSRKGADYEVEMESDTLLQYSHNFWGEHCTQLSKEDRQSLGVSDLLLDWLVKGSGSTKFQDWQHTIPKFYIYSGSRRIKDVSGPIFAACIWNLVEVVEELLPQDQKYSHNVKLDSKDNYGRTALSRAAENGHEAIVKLLLDTGKVDVDSKDNYGRTALSRAAANGHKAIVKLLLDTGKVDVDSKDTDGRTALWWAAANGDEAIVKLLLDTGKVDVDSKDSEYGQTALSRAAWNGHEAIVKLLLDTGKVDVDSKDNGGGTALSRAAANGHEAIVKLLQSSIAT